jgi:hypothetical protein
MATPGLAEGRRSVIGRADPSVIVRTPRTVRAGMRAVALDCGSDSDARLGCSAAWRSAQMCEPA